MVSNLAWWCMCERTVLRLLLKRSPIFNTSRPRQNCPDHISKCISPMKNVFILIEITLKCWCPIGNTPVLVQIMAGRQIGDKPLSKWRASLLTYICVIRARWVNHHITNDGVSNHVSYRSWCCILNFPRRSLLNIPWPLGDISLVPNSKYNYDSMHNTYFNEYKLSKFGNFVSQKHAFCSHASILRPDWNSHLYCVVLISGFLRSNVGCQSRNHTHKWLTCKTYQ